MTRLPIIALTLASATAAADTGDLALGPILSGGWPAEGRAAGNRIRNVVPFPFSEYKDTAPE